MCTWGWIRKRTTKCRVARFCLRLLGRVERLHDFRTVGPYVRTYHNLTSEWLTRASQQGIEDEAARQGLQKIEVQQAWQDLLNDGVLRKA